MIPITPGMSYERMSDTALAANPQLTIELAILPGDIAGVCCPSLDTILIDQRQTDTRKRCALAHELVHYRHGDDTTSGWAGAKAEHRCRRQTALLLVNPAEYAIAEAMYDGDVYRIAAELDVTTQIIHDWQHILREATAQTEQFV
ncbi:ImmA/IrrE family metallo-endopeptidase [Bifidobacterium vansinderenii]|uniref:IrrE N-terminal-like domain-containing protein n=1 Tax=Bifidobacterium vansinderenii TaxID=1984871 RepID=A0A229W188_9BIFI|nr:ImmA/IrrE family metallo-endopeptidase [Bifidobacterium vansinderenii]OXN01618.1 hypothetical protein Tam10B_0061 [Bifidobacterium vansinderenii]